MVLKKIVSGGQTGVDRAALDVALSMGLPCGGWCPKGRRAEDGTIPPHYPLVETPSEEYWERTLWNVRDSDATLILCLGVPRGGTALTLELAKSLKKPCFFVPLEEDFPARILKRWLSEYAVEILNIAGPRESTCPGIYELSKIYLESFLRQFLYSA
jgi:hypothetical protein